MKFDHSLPVSFKKTSIVKQFPAHFTREVLFLMVDHIHVRLQVGLGVEFFHTTLILLIFKSDGISNLTLKDVEKYLS